MRAYDVVTAFEQELASYTGAPRVVCVDSCTNALQLSMEYYEPDTVVLPRRTYLGVAQAALNAGFDIEWRDVHWRGSYQIEPLPLWDCAKALTQSMYVPGRVQCVSFHIAKQLPLGRGGAVLTDDDAMWEWLQRAKLSGRTPGETGEEATRVTRPAHHMFMTPDVAARGLWLLQQFVDQPLNDSWEHYPDVSKLLEGA